MKEHLAAAWKARLHVLHVPEANSLPIAVMSPVEAPGELSAFLSCCRWPGYRSSCILAYYTEDSFM
jgi:hypothetical protein